jgi:hypothetical protein
LDIEVGQLIAIYTFAAISTETGLRSMRNTAAIVVSLWLFILILVGIGHATNHKSSFMSPAPVSLEKACNL